MLLNKKTPSVSREDLTRHIVYLMKSFCGGYRGAVFTKRAPLALAAGGNGGNYER